MKARPTIRCLLDSLREGITDPNQRSALIAGRLESLGPVPLDEIAHPLLVKATEQFGERTLVELHEYRISAVRDVDWYQSKVGRHRGAVWIDLQGQAWLCAAGTRRAEDNDDFYNQFERQCAGGSSVFLPTEDDLKRLRLEAVYEAEDRRGTLLRERVVAALMHAAQDRTTVTSALPTAFDNGTLEPVDGAILILDVTWGDPGEITLSIEVTDYAAGHYNDVVHEIQMALPSVPLSDWDVIPATGDHLDPCWYALVDPEWIERFVTDIASRGVQAFVGDPPDLTDGPDGFSHLVNKNGLFEATVEGVAVRAICGRSFIPRSDPDAPVCQRCAADHETLERLCV
jgi:hypothetical protein